MVINVKKLKKQFKRHSQSVAFKEFIKMIPWFLIFDGVILILSFPLGYFSFSVLLGLIYGSLLSLARYYTLGLAVDSAVSKSPERGQTFMAVTYVLRYILTFLLLIASVTLFNFNIIGTVLPLIYPIFIIFIQNLKKDKQDGSKEEKKSENLN